MQIHQLKPTHKKKSRKRIGRGGKRGTYSGRGVKGQKARSGGKSKAKLITGRRSLIKKLAKIKGFKSIHPKLAIVNLGQIDKEFTSGQEVTPQSLLKKGLVDNIRKGVKILSQGEISKKIVVRGVKLSKKAKEKIEKVDGIIEL